MPTILSEAYLSFLGSLRRRFKVHALFSEPVESHIGVPEGCAFAVYNMLQLSWYILIYVEKRQAAQSTVVSVNYVDNWLFHSAQSEALKQSIQDVHSLASWSNFRISGSKTWSSSTSSEVRSGMSSWAAGG